VVVSEFNLYTSLFTEKPDLLTMRWLLRNGYLERAAAK